MKFYLYTNKQSDIELKAVKLVLKKLLPESEIEEGKGKPGKYKEDKLSAERAVIIKVEDVYNKSRREIAIKLLEVLDMGVSERVLNTL